MWKDMFTIRGRWNRLNRLRYFKYNFIVPAIIMVLIGISITIAVATISGYQAAKNAANYSFVNPAYAQIMDSDDKAIQNNLLVDPTPSPEEMNKKIGGFFSFGALGINILLMVLLTWISICLGIKRLHDIGWSGWWIILMFVPFVNIVISLILLFKRGTFGENKYGPDPLELDAINYLEKVKQAKASA